MSLINLIIYFSVQIDKRDHRKENRSCTVAGFHRDSGHSNLKWWGYKYSREQSHSSVSALVDADHVPPPELGSPLIPLRRPCCLCPQASPRLSSWIVSSHALCRITVHQKLAQGILTACSDKTWRRFKRIHIFFKS